MTLPSVLDGRYWSALRPDCYNSLERALSTHRTKWAVHVFCLHTMAKTEALEPRNFILIIFHNIKLIS